MNVTLIFAEGAHDIAFLGRLLLCGSGNARSRRAIRELPSPLDTFFRNRIAQLAIGDYRLDQALNMCLPRLEAAYERTDGAELWLLLKCGGDSAGDRTKALLNDLQAVVRSPLRSKAQETGPSINELHTIHVFDADAEDVENRLKEFNKIFGPFYGCEVARPNEFTATEFCSGYMCCILGGEPKICTLEDLIWPLAAATHGTYFECVGEVLAGRAEAPSWTRDRESARFKKAVLTVVGQAACPGGSLATILGHESVLHTDDQIVSCPRCLSVYKAIRGKAEWS